MLLKLKVWLNMSVINQTLTVPGYKWMVAAKLYVAISSGE